MTRDESVPPVESDADLVGRCVQGDAAAWESLVQRHAGLVWAVAGRGGMSREDAMDVFQNTWIEALEHLSRLRDPQAFAAWIGRIAHHQTMRVRRSYGIARKSMPHVAREDVDESLPDEDIEALEIRGVVREALAKSGERCRELLRALYEEDPTPPYDVIASRMGMRIGSIGPTRARCLEKLLKLLPEGADVA